MGEGSLPGISGVTGLTEEWGGRALQAWPALSCLQAPFSPPWGVVQENIHLPVQINHDD